MSLAGLRSLHELLLVYNSTNDSNPEEHNQEDWQTKNGVGGPALDKKSMPTSANFTSSTSSVNAPTSTSSLSKTVSEDEIWACTWTVWMRIAMAATTTSGLTVDSQQLANQTNCTATASHNSTGTSEDRRYLSQQSLQHRQQFLTALLQIFPLIFTHIKTR